MVARCFLKVSSNMEPIAAIRLVIDSDSQQIRDEFWNPSLATWEAGSFGTEAIALGVDNVYEVGERGIVKIFLDCPLDDGLFCWATSPGKKTGFIVVFYSTSEDTVKRCRSAQGRWLGASRERSR